MTTSMTALDRHDPRYRGIVDKIAKASHRAFIEAGCPVPEWFEDTNLSVAFDFVDEIVYRGREIEERT